MPWGDDDPTLVKAKGATQAAPVASSWGDNDPAIAAAPKAMKTSQGLGFMENFARPFEQFSKVNPAGVLDTQGTKDFYKKQQQDMHRYFDKREETERPGLLGGVAGSILGTAPVLAVTRNPLAVGAAQGALTSEHDDLGGIALDAGLGAVLNKAAGKLTDVAADALKPVISPAVSMMQKAGVRMTPGQIKGGKALVREDKAMSRPIVGDRIAADRGQFVDDFNRGAVNRALLPLGVRLPDHVATGHDAVAFMQDTAGKAYDKILPGLKLQADPRLAAGLRRGWAAAQDLAPADQDRFLQIVKNKLRFDQNGTLTGRPLAVALRDLRDLAQGFAKGADEDKRILGSALDEVHDGLQHSLAAQNPAAGQALKAANQAYKGNLVVTRAAAAADDGIAGTGQFKQASKAIDRSKGKRATGRGEGPMQDYVKAGREVTGKTPDSGTAGRLLDGNWIAKARGVADAGLYEADKALTGLKFATRPAQAQKLAGLLRQYEAPIRAVTGPAVGGLLAGLLGNE